MSGDKDGNPESWSEAASTVDSPDSGDSGPDAGVRPGGPGSGGAWQEDLTVPAASVEPEDVLDSPSPDEEGQISGSDGGTGVEADSVPGAGQAAEEAAEAESPREPARKKKVLPQKEALPHFPPLRVEPQAPPTVLSRLFELGAMISPLLLSALVIVQVFYGLQELRPLWVHEAEQAEVLRNVLGGDWMILMLNGSVYFDVPPLYFWFLSGIHELLAWPVVRALVPPAADGIAQAMFFGTALSGLLLLWAVLCMAKFVAGLDRRGVFAAGCVLLSMFLFGGALHYAAPDLFFAALVVFSQVFMFQALRRRSCMPLMGAGFAFAALASLTGGPLGLGLPVVSAVIFAFWQGKPWRLLRKDFLLGFAFSLLPAIIWIGSIWAEGYHEVVVGLFREQLWGMLLHSLRYPESWWYYLILLPLLLLPWVLLAVFPHWGGLFSRELRAALKSAFRGDHQGLSFVWISLICALAGFFLLSAKSPLNLLTLFAPLSIIAGRLALGLSPVRNVLLQRCYAALFIIAALLFAVVPVYMSGTAPSALNWLGSVGVPVIGTDIDGVFVLAAIFLAAGCLFLGALNSRRPEGTLLVMLALTVCLSYPLSVMTAPSLGTLFSPAGPSEEIGKLARQGLKPYALDADPAPFVYYAGSGITPLPPDAAPGLPDLPELAEGGFVLLAPAGTNYGLDEAAGFKLAGVEYVLLVKDRPVPASVAPVEEPERSAPDSGQPGDVHPDTLQSVPAEEAMDGLGGVIPDAPEERIAQPVFSGTPDEGPAAPEQPSLQD